MTDPLDGLLTLRDFIRWAASRFNEVGLCFGHGTDNALDEAVMLILGLLHLPPDLPPAYLDARLTTGERRQVAAMVERRIEERVPTAYLTGEAWFGGLPFHVSERVLVPRSPIAELIANGFSPWIEYPRVSRILDLCTGSGCIGVASALNFPAAQVDLVDVSEPALEIANRNVLRHGVQEQVRVIQSDLFAGLQGMRYDLIVSNPPYVGREELAALPSEFHWEPQLGLAGGEDGLAIVRRILREASDFLTADGIIVVEVGSSAEALMALYPGVPFLWLDFEQGGDGVFLLTAGQVAQYRDDFDSR